MIKKILKLNTIAFYLLLPYISFAQAPMPKLAQPAPGVGATLEDFIRLLIEIMQAVGFPFLVVCIIYAGFKIATAGGNEDQIAKGKVMIFWTLIGAAIIISAQVIADIVYGTASSF